MCAQNLHANGKSGFRCATRDGNAANTGQARGHGVDIGQVHGEGIAGLLAQLEWGAGRSRLGVTMASTSAKAANEFSRGRRSDFLRFEVVGIVIAGPESA